MKRSLGIGITLLHGIWNFGVGMRTGIHRVVRSTLSIDALIVSRILIRALKETRLRRALLHFAGALIIVGECVAHAESSDPFRLSELDRASSVCKGDPDLAPLVSPTRAVNCDDMDLYLALRHLGRDEDAYSYTFLIAGAKAEKHVPTPAAPAVEDSKPSIGESK